MQNVLLKIAFDGTRYHGYQVQKNALSICEVIQDAMEKVLGERCDVKGSSRTDTGVHANGFCLSFIMKKDIPSRKIPLALNAHLPKDIRIMKAMYVEDDFHARYASTAKRYIYRIRNHSIDSPINGRYECRVSTPLDVEKMQHAAKHLVGKHDFTSFMSLGNKPIDTVREIYSFTVIKENENIIFTVTANGYLYNMVRIMIGTLVEIGASRMDKDEIPKILQSKDRSKAGDTLAAKGLFLDKVFYEGIDI